MQDNKLFEGKVRKIFDAGEGKLLIVTTDRISAYDVIMPTPIDGKGKILNGLSMFWFGAYRRTSSRTTSSPPTLMNTPNPSRATGNSRDARCLSRS